MQNGINTGIGRYLPVLILIDYLDSDDFFGDVENKGECGGGLGVKE